MVGLVALIVLTTVGAGVPAYLLTRRQLQRQAWQQLAAAQQATQSLLDSELVGLADLTTLFAGRPTLNELLTAGAAAELNSYLEAFLQQSTLDFLLVCGETGSWSAGDIAADLCAQPWRDGYQLIGASPAQAIGKPIVDGLSGETLGMALAGNWLDSAALRDLAAASGAEQSVVNSEGRRLASSLEIGPSDLQLGPAAAVADQAQIDLNSAPYYAGYLPAPESGAPGEVLIETALPVSDLLTATRQAFFILIGSTAVITAIGALLGSHYVSQLSRPLQKLTAAAERISSGDLMAPIPVVAQPREIASLATALHQGQSSMQAALRQLSQARDRLDALLQAIIEGVVTIDSDGRVTFFSLGAERLTGWPAEEALGREINELLLVAGDAGQGFLQALGDGAGKRQIAVQTIHGKRMALAVSSAEMTSDLFEKPHRVLVLRDTTEEDALRHLRSYFLANISHEFRTPLSALLASLELMLDPVEDLSAQEMRQLLKPGYLSLRALQTLIDNLLESSSVEAGRFELHRRPVDLDEVLQGAMQIAGPLLERREQPLIVAKPGDLPALVGDSGRLMQALVNLIVNASKYSPPGEAIDLQLSAAAGRLRVAVADRGPGIPAPERENVFRRFVRGVASNGDQYGIGLGLYVVRTVVEAHGGVVGVEGRPGGGAVFWFELPLAAEERI